MKFFIPYTETTDQAMKILNALKALASSTGWAVEDKYVRRLEWEREAKTYTAEVGEKETRVGEEVVAILEASAYLVYTPSMGVVKGMPLIVGKNEVKSIEYFDAE